MQVKYESDMSPKEKRQAEIAKIRALSWTDKIVHMWSYHKVILFSPVILALFIWGSISFVQNLRYEDVLNVAVSHGDMTLDRLTIVEELKQNLGIESQYAELFIDGSYFFSDMQDHNVIQKFVTKVAASAIDVFITDLVPYNHYHDAEFFKPLDLIFTQEELDQLTIINGDAIDMTEYVEQLTHFFGVHYTPVYFTVIGNVDLEQVNLGRYVRGDTIRELVFLLTGITPSVTR